MKASRFMIKKSSRHKGNSGKINMLWLLLITCISFIRCCGRSIIKN
jgi:hypothetical protein